MKLSVVFVVAAIVLCTVGSSEGLFDGIRNAKDSFEKTMSGATSFCGQPPMKAYQSKKECNKLATGCNNCNG